MRALGWMASCLLLVAACGPGTGDDETAACQLHKSQQGCPECYDGEVTCSYGDISVTEGSCGGCQAQAALYEALCAAGVDDSKAEIESGMECHDADGTGSD